MINTRGFVVDNMPRYQPVDPTLVAFNPAQVTDGMLSAFNVAKAYEQLKASKAMQAELEATRQARIGAQNAQNQAIVKTADPVATDTLDQLFANSKVRGPQTDLTLRGITGQLNNADAKDAASLAGLKLGAAKDTAGLAAVTPMVNRDIAVAGAQEAQAGQDKVLAPQRGAYESQHLQSLSKDLNDADAVRTETLSLAKKKLADQLDNFTDDADAKRALADYTAAEKAANAKYASAHADYLESMAKTAAMKPSEKISAEIQAAERVRADLAKERFMMPDGSTIGTLGTYEQMMYPKGRTGKPGYSGALFWKSPYEPNQMAEDNLKVLHAQTDRISKLTALRDRISKEEESGGSNVVSTKDQYDKLPPGSVFQGADGKTYTKPAR